MKKLFLIPILFLFLTVAHGQEVINTSFEDYSSGSIFGQDDWVDDNDNDGDAAVVTMASHVHTGSKGVQLSSTTAVETILDHIAYGKDETGLSSNVYLDFWVKVISAPSNDESIYIRVMDYLPDGGVRRASEIRMYADGDMKVDGANDEVSTDLYTVGDWIRISLSVDYATVSYEVAINGTVLDETFDFREDYQPSDKDRPSNIKEYHMLRFWYEDAIGDIALDDVYIGTEPIEDIAFTEPSTERTITVKQPDHAEITLSPAQDTYEVGDVVTATLSGIPDHYVFDGWTGSFSGTENPLTITVAGNATIGAAIIIDESNPPAEYTIDITHPEGGTITVDPSEGPYYEGATVEFEATASIGYTFESWTGISGSESSVEVTMSGNLEVSAVMALGSFTKRTVAVANGGELEDALEAMLPGDSIVLADGTYNGISETLENKGGTIDFPVYIIAANQGMAKITGSSKFTFENSAYITLQGIDFDVDGVNNIFKLTDSHHIRICYNTITSAKADGSSKWFEIGGIWDADVCLSHHNRIDHNLIEGKLDGGALLVIGGNSGNPTPAISQYDRIDHNHFKNVGPRQTNEKETIRVGWSKISLLSAYCTIEDNLFEECDGDPEIISVKSCDNYVRNNTFLRSLGTVSLRHGNRTEISGNYFFGDGKTAEFDGGTIGCGGVRVYGKDHKIFNNYFEGLTGSRWDAACTLTQGDASNSNVSQSSDLTKHYVIENLEFTHNTLINNASDIEIGYRDDWGRKPINTLIANNIIVQNANPVTKVYFSGQDDDVNFADNIIFTSGNGSWGDISFTASEATDVDPLLEKTNCKVPEESCSNSSLEVFKLTSSSPALDASVSNSYAYANSDIDGQSANGTRDIGADEYNSSAAVTSIPLTASDVGTGVADEEPEPEEPEEPETLNAVTMNEALASVQPNPFEGTTTFISQGEAQVTVYHLTGGLVDSFLMKEQYEWQAPKAGVYICHFTVKGHTQVRKLIAK